MYKHKDASNMLSGHEITSIIKDVTEQYEKTTKSQTA